MSRPRSDNPKEHTSIIRAKRKDGWTYIQRVVSVYDPKIKTAEEFQRRLWENFRPVKLIWRNWLLWNRAEEKVHFKRLRLPHLPKK